VPAAQVAGHAVAPEEGQRIVGQRPDDRHPAARRQRQHPAGVGQQDDRLLGQPPGQRPVGRRPQVDVGAGVRDGGPALVQHPQVALLAQDPARGPVDQLRRDQPGAHRRGQRGAVAPDAGQLDVHAGVEGQRAGLRRRARHGVLGLQERDRPVVRDDHAVEAELVPERPGQQPAVPGDRHAVDVGVGRHH
jgi:hypothetical protein